MSKYNEEEITCPNPECAEKSKVKIWRSLDTTLDPDVKKDLLEGKINTFACEKCGLKNVVAEAFSYYDKERKFEVFYIPFFLVQSKRFINGNLLKNIFSSDGKINIGESNVPGKYIPSCIGDAHIVFSMPELARYVIFRENLFKKMQYMKRIKLYAKKDDVESLIAEIYVKDNAVVIESPDEAVKELFETEVNSRIKKDGGLSIKYYGEISNPEYLIDHYSSEEFSTIDDEDFMKAILVHCFAQDSEQDSSGKTTIRYNFCGKLKRMGYKLDSYKSGVVEE